MKRQIAWIVRGSTRTQRAFDDHSEVIRDLQRRLADLETVVARLDVGGGSPDGSARRVDIRLDEIGARLDAIGARVDRVDTSLSELVRVVAPPTVE